MLLLCPGRILLARFNIKKGYKFVYWGSLRRCHKIPKASEGARVPFAAADQAEQGRTHTQHQRPAIHASDAATLISAFLSLRDADHTIEFLPNEFTNQVRGTIDPCPHASSTAQVRSQQPIPHPPHFFAAALMALLRIGRVEHSLSRSRGRNPVPRRHTWPAGEGRRVARS